MAPGLFIKRRRVWMPCAFVTALVLIYALWPEPKAKPAPSLPSPNGYDDFAKAGQLLNMSSADYARMPREELMSYVKTNQEPLRLVRLGLTSECRVPTEDSMAYIERHMANLTSFKRLAQLLSAEGLLAEADGRYESAAAVHLEVLRFGQASPRRGLMIDKLVGVAIENIGLVGLERIAPRLKKLPCQRTIQALEEIDASADSAADYIKRDQQWERAAMGVSGWVRTAWAYKSLNPFRQNDQSFTAKVLGTERRRRQLLLNLASRAYELENGKRPSRAEELVPSVLRAVPKDPETGTNLVLNPAL